MDQNQEMNPQGFWEDEIYKLKQSLENVSCNLKGTETLVMKEGARLGKVKREFLIERMKHEIDRTNLATLLNKEEKVIWNVDEENSENPLAGLDKHSDEAGALINKMKVCEEEISEETNSFVPALIRVFELRKFVDSESDEIGKLELEFKKIFKNCPTRERDPSKSVEKIKKRELIEKLLELKAKVTHFIEENTVLVEMREKLESESSERDSKITNWENKLMKLIEKKMRMMKSLNVFITSEVEPFVPQKLISLKIKYKELEEKNKGLENSLEKMKREFELQLQQREEKSQLSQNENKINLTEIDQKNEEIRDKEELLNQKNALLREKDQEIAKLMLNLEQTEEKQKFAEKRIAEKNDRIEQLERNLKECSKVADKVLSKIQEAKDERDEDFEVKEEDNSLETKRESEEIYEESTLTIQEKHPDSPEVQKLEQSLKAKILKQDEELERMKAFFEGNYVTKEALDETLKKLQSFVQEERKWEKQSEKQSNKGDKQLMELNLNIEKEDCIARKSEKKEPPGSGPRNGKRNLDSLLANSDDGAGRKTAPKGKPSRRNSKKERENMKAGQDSSELVEVDQFVKKIKQDLRI